MKRCVTCGIIRDLTEFNRKRRARDGHQNVCRDCNRSRARRYYRENRERHLQVIAARTAAAKALARDLIGSYLLAHPCLDCGERDIRVLDFDHRPEAGKTRDVMYLVRNGYSVARILAEVAKCDVRCRNCHARATYDRAPADWRTAFMSRAVGSADADDRTRAVGAITDECARTQRS